MNQAKDGQILITSKEYDSRFYELINNLERCACSNINCDACPVKVECQELFDSLADRVTHYRISEKDYQAFMNHFKSLKKQLVLC